MKTEKVWDAPTRWFHWINVVVVLVLALSGFFFLFREDFHVDGKEAKMALKTAHSWLGYVFAINLAGRFLWAFLGNRHARWRAILPGWQSLRSIPSEIRSLINRRPVEYSGRGPISRVSSTFMFLLLLVMATTGLMRAGMDMYYPPLGPYVAAFVANPGVDPSTITWRTEKELANGQRLQDVNQIKTVVGLTHQYSACVLLGMIVLHIAGVVLQEVRQQSGLVSTMISGRRTFLEAQVERLGDPARDRTESS